MSGLKGQDGPAFLTSAVLTAAGFRHAFFTRRGGASEGAYASLNFSVTAGDRPEAVAENMERAAGVLRVPATGLYFLSQVHGAVTHVVEDGASRDEIQRREGDAIVGRSSTSAVGVRIADCVPVLVGDLRSGAALAIHAGWKGLVAGIIPSGIARLREVIGAQGDLVAAIGPHITVRAFEVSEEVATVLAGCIPQESVVERHRGPKPQVALDRIARAQLLAAGIDASRVELVPGCTYSEPDRFFSFRRDGAKSGRHLAAIVPRG